MFFSAELLAGNGLVEISEPKMPKSELPDSLPTGGDKMKELFQIGGWEVDRTSISNSARMQGFSKYQIVPTKPPPGKIEGRYGLLQPEGPLNLMEFYMQLQKINFESGGWAHQLALSDRSLESTGKFPDAGKYAKFYENISARYRAIESEVVHANPRIRVKHSVTCMVRPNTNDPKLQELMYQCYGEQLRRFAYAGERICMMFREGQKNEKDSDANSKGESSD
ncbi:hypothetical protein B9Z55_026553 [Caenorhabditis nigoni]|uniref:Uncharacterized protein n=1 Tax=Caenorhabditis nigoni TaxID=1611254 RepID=A0A2G5T3S5_9PELO|nr:hypothetical protein B9Z55_026553 [Caenorhabditis nigoni]